MPTNSAGADKELLSDLGVAHPMGHQAQHLHLAGAEPGGVGLWGEGLLQRRRAIQHVLDGFLEAHRSSLRPRRLECFLAEPTARGSYLAPMEGAVGYISVHSNFDLLEQRLRSAPQECGTHSPF